MPKVNLILQLKYFDLNNKNLLSCYLISYDSIIVNSIK